MSSPPFLSHCGSARTARAGGAAAGLAGLLVVVAGTFMPWLTSGGVQRNSYAVAGIVRRLRFLDGGPAATTLSLWPLLGTVAMLPVIAGILRWWRTAAIATLLFGLLTGVGAAAVLAVAGGHQAAGIGLSSTGPVVTLTGATLAVVGAVVVLLAQRRSRPPGRFRANPAGQVSAEPAEVPFRRTAHSATSDRSGRRPPHSPQQTADSTMAVQTERDSPG